MFPLGRVFDLYSLLSNPCCGGLFQSLLKLFRRIHAAPEVRRLPEMWYIVRKGDCGNNIEMEFTQAPMGIVFQAWTLFLPFVLARIMSSVMA